MTTSIIAALLSPNPMLLLLLTLAGLLPGIARAGKFRHSAILVSAWRLMQGAWVSDQARVKDRLRSSSPDRRVKFMLNKPC